MDAPRPDPDRADRGLFLVEVALLLLGLAAYLSTVRPFFGVSADDAYISFRYALNWAAGCGPRFSCGEPPVEGYTNFLWVTLAALGLRAGLEAAPLMRLLGLLAGAIALLLCACLCRRLHRQRWSQLLPLIGLGASPFYAVNAVNGLETVAATASVLGAALLSLRLPAGPRPWLAGLGWAFSYLIRPEAIAFATLTGLYSLLGGLLRGLGARRSFWGTLQLGLGFLAVAGPYFLWRLLYYGSLFPNTLEAKRVSLAVLLPRNFRLLWEHGTFFVVVLVLALLALLWRRRGELLYLFLLALLAAGISLSVHNNFWMPGHRLYLTSLALLLCVGAGTLDLVERGDGRLRWWGALPGLAGVALLLCCSWLYQPGTKLLAGTHYARDDHPARRMGELIKRLARPGDWLVIRDAGMVPFHAGSRVKVLDMHDRSLNDRRIARQGWDLPYVMGRDPRFVVLASHTPGAAPSLAHPVEERILGWPDFARRWRLTLTVPWHAGRHFFLYVRP